LTPYTRCTARCSIIESPQINGFNGDNGASINQALTPYTPRR
jgi:hypothetical protein